MWQKITWKFIKNEVEDKRETLILSYLQKMIVNWQERCCLKQYRYLFNLFTQGSYFLPLLLNEMLVFWFRIFLIVCFSTIVVNVWVNDPGVLDTSLFKLMLLEKNMHTMLFFCELQLQILCCW